MATFEEQFYVEKGGPFTRLRRNVRLLIYLGRLTLGWYFMGRRLRRHEKEYEAGKADKIYVDRLTDPKTP